VQAYDDPVGLAACFANLSQIFRHILFIARCPDVESFAELIMIAAVAILDGAGGTDFRRCVKAMIDHPLRLPVESESGAKTLESGEGFLVDDEGGFKAQCIHSRLAANRFAGSRHGSVMRVDERLRQ
jgi:hypothetical protein